jgi:hypothetical protein
MDYYSYIDNDGLYMVQQGGIKEIITKENKRNLKSKMLCDQKYLKCLQLTKIQTISLISWFGCKPWPQGMSLLIFMLCLSMMFNDSISCPQE